MCVMCTLLNVVIICSLHSATTACSLLLQQRSVPRSDTITLGSHIIALQNEKMKIYALGPEIRKCELHLCLRHVMRLCRWIGLYPVEGLHQETSNRIRFTLNSFYTYYYVTSFVGQIMMTFFSLYWFLENNMTLIKLSNFIFYSTGLVYLILLLRLAKNWPRLIKKAWDIERNLAKIRITRNTSSKATGVAYVVMILALVEHILSKVSNLNHSKWCLGESTLSPRVMEHYFINRMSFVFDYIPYNTLTAILSVLFCLQTTFLWSISDVIIMCISTYLTSYFHDLNKSINAYKKKVQTPWSEFRVHYSHLVVLVKEINSQLEQFVLISFFVNLFFICLQLFYSLHSSAVMVPKYLVYYVFSFLFCMGRALTVSILAAYVHSAAQEPIVALYEVPASDYNIEVQRFQLQLRYTTTGLSGVFFYVTRKLILRVVGTIITYELVLLQFSMNHFKDITDRNHTSVHAYFKLGK